MAMRLTPWEKPRNRFTGLVDTLDCGLVYCQILNGEWLSKNSAGVNTMVFPGSLHIPAKMNTHSGNMNTDSGIPGKSVHFEPE